jgi:hypothetical protein
MIRRIRLTLRLLTELQKQFKCRAIYSHETLLSEGGRKRGSIQALKATDQQLD